MEEPSAKRSYVKKSDFILIAGILAVAVVSMIGFKLYQGRMTDETLWAVIDAPDGEYRIDLSAVTEPTLLDLEPVAGLPATLEIQDRRCRLVNVDCPDHICEGFGWLSAGYDTAVCMPNRFVVGIYTEKEMGSRMETAVDITP